jgi:hypothetical protein
MSWMFGTCPMWRSESAALACPPVAFGLVGLPAGRKAAQELGASHGSPPPANVLNCGFQMFIVVRYTVVFAGLVPGM